MPTTDIVAPFRSVSGQNLLDHTLVEGRIAGPLLNNVWVKLPGIYRLLLGGTGTVALDTRARDGTVTTGVATYSPAGPGEDFPYFDNAYEVRATLTGTATAEIV